MALSDLLDTALAAGPPASSVTRRIACGDQLSGLGDVTVGRLMPSATVPGSLRIEPLTPERWPDVEALFGRGGASYGCWCMFFRRTSTEMSKCQGRRQQDRPPGPRRP